MLQCTDGRATPHSAFPNLIELTRGGSALADSSLVARCYQVCLVDAAASDALKRGNYSQRAESVLPKAGGGCVLSAASVTDRPSLLPLPRASSHLTRCDSRSSPTNRSSSAFVRCDCRQLRSQGKRYRVGSSSASSSGSSALTHVEEKGSLMESLKATSPLVDRLSTS